jgi:alpha-beta hydrolase superfamily lysophospholipase
MIAMDFHMPFSGETIYGKYYVPGITDGVIILVHGLGEHCGRYEELVIPALLGANLGVITYDQFGHGKTTGKRGHHPGFGELLGCITEMIAKSEKIFGEKRIFLYGHSMGGNVVLNYGLRFPNSVSGIVASSPFLKLAFEPPAWKLAFGNWMRKIYPSLTVSNEINPSHLSHDAEVVKAYIADPLNHDRVSPNYSVLLIETGSWAIQNAGRLKKPVLIIHGTADQLTSYKGSEAFAANNQEMVNINLYPGAYHELHNEPGREEVLKDVTNWLRKKLHSQ